MTETRSYCVVLELAMYNSRPQTCSSACLCLPSVEVKSMGYCAFTLERISTAVSFHTTISKIFTVSLFYTSPLSCPPTPTPQGCRPWKAASAPVDFPVLMNIQRGWERGGGGEHIRRLGGKVGGRIGEEL